MTSHGEKSKKAKRMERRLNMNKRNIKPTFWILAVFFTVGMFPNNASAQDYGSATRPPFIPRKPSPYNPNPKNPRAEQARPTITVTEGSVVPAQTTYFVYDETGTKLLKTFTHGQRVILHAKKLAKKEAPKPPELNCVQVNCPASFGANVTCWKCK
jgi:hypothetical protein